MGRPRVYCDAAEKQAAYRRRKRAGVVSPEVASVLDDLYSGYVASRNSGFRRGDPALSLMGLLQSLADSYWSQARSGESFGSVGLSGRGGGQV